MTVAADGIAVFGANLNKLKEGCLYGDDQQKKIDEMRTELEQLETKVVEDVGPLFKKILAITEPAAEEYYQKSLLKEYLLKDAGINAGKPVAWKIGDVNRRIGNLSNRLKARDNLNRLAAE